MNTTLRKYNEADTPFEVVLDAVLADRWSDPSPCESWSARDVIGHVIETQRDYMEGICKPGAEADPDADRLTKVLAKLGR